MEDETAPIVEAPELAPPDWAPAGAHMQRCTACGETRMIVPGDLRDPWHHHDDACPP